jgi:hypothetical protein
MEAMPESSRVDAGRQRASAAKRAVALTAAGGFLVVFGLARHAHPGTAATPPSGSTLSSGISSDRQGFSLGGGSIGPSSSGGSAAPPVRSSSS